MLSESPNPVEGRDGTLAGARRVLMQEAATLQQVALRLDGEFAAAIEILDCAPGRIAVTGVGKCAPIGQKTVGTLNSTGTRAYFLDATAAMHGDLGMVHADDAVLILSHSGASEEIIRLLPLLRRRCAAIIALTALRSSPLARAADVAIAYGPVAEACPLSLAPSTSTTVMLALGDALAFALCTRRGFSAEEFATNHPGGKLGRRFARVDQYMRRGQELRMAAATDSIRAVLAQGARPGRRTGAVILLDAEGRIVGLFTDSDLARLFERRAECQLDRPIQEVMTRDPWTIPHGSRLDDALNLLCKNKISELPVIDHEQRPVGMLDITDLIHFLPAEEVWGAAPALTAHAA